LGVVLMEIFGLDTEDIFVTIIVMLITSFVGYFFANLILTKSMRIKKIRGFIAYSLVFVLFLCSLGFDFFGFESAVPSVDSVEAVYLSSSTSGLSAFIDKKIVYEAYSNGKQHWTSNEVDVDYTAMADVFTSEEDIKKAVDIHRGIIEHHRTKGNGSGVSFRIFLSYKLKNGSTITRRYLIENAPEKLTEDIYSLINREDNLLKYYFNAVPKNITTTKIAGDNSYALQKDITDAFMADLREGAFDRLFDQKSTYEYCGVLCFSYENAAPHPASSQYSGYNSLTKTLTCEISVFSNCANILAALKELNIPLTYKDTYYDSDKPVIIEKTPI